MKISYQWLKDYLSFNLSPEEVSLRLTACGLEVEALEVFSPYPGSLREVVVGQVIQCAPHPDADRLSLTLVDTGTGEPLPIVCGAPNVAAGQKVLVAKTGAKVRFGAEEVELKKTKIRGQVSEGMICAEDELGLGTSHDGIMVLPEESKVGMPASEYLGVAEDWIFTIGLTPNRSDGASHYGVARDLATVLKNEAREAGKMDSPKLALPDVSDFKTDHSSLEIPVEVKDPKLCPRYTSITMQGLKVGPSPRWMQDRLKAIGLRPINNLVDISNYVLMETGQPLHFFDADQIRGRKVIVGCLPEGTPFTTLDEAERKLSAEDLMICDAKGGMCIAGVFGGIRSGVTENTTAIFIESAAFDPVSVRKTSRRHDLKTDASFRFERGSDPEMTVYALKRAVQLIRQLAGGEVSAALQDFYPKPVLPVALKLSLPRVEMLIGKKIPADQIVMILESLDIRVKAQAEDDLEIEIPPYRVDVTREADVVEEILRIYGYNALPFPEKMTSSLAYTHHPHRDLIRNQVSDMLAGQAWNEVMCNSQSNSQYYEWQEAWKLENCVRLLNPVSQDLDVMRQTLFFGGLETLRYNLNRRQQDIRIFEFGNTYRTDGSQPVAGDTLAPYTEENALMLMLTGRAFPESWNTADRPADFFDLKAAILNILQRMGIREYSFEDATHPLLSEGLLLKAGQKELGWLGQVKDAFLRRFDIAVPVFAASLSWDTLIALLPEKKMQFRPIPRYPEVRRDLALVIDKSIPYARLEEVALQTERKILREVHLFDVYEGKGIEEGKKSYALRFILQDEEKTLTDKAIDKTMQRIQAALEKECGAKLR